MNVRSLRRSAGRCVASVATCLLLSWSALAAHAGQYDDGLRWLEAKAYSKAIAAFRSAAARGNAAAEREVGFMYYNGKGIRRNIPIALRWFEKSAQHGDLQSQTSLGQMYENGLFVPKNDAAAAKWFALAAEQGHPGSQLRMGEISYLGTGVPRDRAEAVKWWELATRDDTEQARHLRSIVQSTWDKIGPEDIAEGRRRANEWVAAKLTHRGG